MVDGDARRAGASAVIAVTDAGQRRPGGVIRGQADAKVDLVGAVEEELLRRRRRAASGRRAAVARDGRLAHAVTDPQGRRAPRTAVGDKAARGRGAVGGAVPRASTPWRVEVLGRRGVLRLRPRQRTVRGVSLEAVLRLMR